MQKKYLKEGLSLSKKALKKLTKYSWPGNIRELRHVLERAVIMCDGMVLRTDDFVLNIQEKERMDIGGLNLGEIEKKAINTALLKHQGNLTSAAKELGLGRTTLYRKIEKYGL